MCVRENIYVYGLAGDKMAGDKIENAKMGHKEQQRNGRLGNKKNN